MKRKLLYMWENFLYTPCKSCRCIRNAFLDFIDDLIPVVAFLFVSCIIVSTIVYLMFSAIKYGRWWPIPVVLFFVMMLAVALKAKERCSWR